MIGGTPARFFVLHPSVASTTTGQYGIAANTVLDLRVLGWAYNELVIRNGRIEQRTL